MAFGRLKATRVNFSVKRRRALIAKYGNCLYNVDLTLVTGIRIFIEIQTLSCTVCHISGEVHVEEP
jgi:hypothetical protein